MEKAILFCISIDIRAKENKSKLKEEKVVFKKTLKSWLAQETAEQGVKKSLVVLSVC